jgi:hypothetical protein
MNIDMEWNTETPLPMSALVRGVVAFIICCVLGFVSVCGAQTSMPSAVNVRLITDEAEAVLAVLAKKKKNQPITEADWQRVFQSEGYIRLKKRESSLKRSFDDADFKTFVLSDQVAEQAHALKETLAGGAERILLAR